MISNQIMSFGMKQGSMPDLRRKLCAEFVCVSAVGVGGGVALYLFGFVSGIVDFDFGARLDVWKN